MRHVLTISSSFIFVLMTGLFLYAPLVFAQTCMSREQVSSDNRCLYVASDKVYEKGTRTDPHQDHPCGTDVTSILPVTHTMDIPTRLTPNYVANICANPTPTTIIIPTTASPTSVQQSVPTAIPTRRPNPTPLPTKRPAPTVRPTAKPTPTAAPTPTRSPTIVPNPTARPAQGDTILQLTLLLHGIGKGGDNSNPQSVGNTLIGHPQRTVTLEVFNARGELLISQQGIVTYQTGAGNFTGYVDIGPNFPSGPYTIKVRTSGYLRKQLGGITQITTNTSTQMPVAIMTTGDANDDNRLNILDYNQFVNCFDLSLRASKCAPVVFTRTDFNDDSYVNGVDYNLFLREVWIQSGQ